MDAQNLQNTINWEAVFLGWFAVSIIISLIVAIRQMNDDIGWREQQIFHPVAMKKFIPMSIISLGFYQVYWIYKNWLWLKYVEHNNISPAWRTIFSLFMNFSLFKRMHRPETPGFSWFGFAATPLAILYFAGKVIDQASGKWDSAPIWFDALALCSVFILIPVAMQVNKMNAGREEFIAKNSNFGWAAVGMIILFLPIFILTIIGLFLR